MVGIFKIKNNYIICVSFHTSFNILIVWKISYDNVCRVQKYIFTDNFVFSDKSAKFAGLKSILDW